MFLTALALSVFYAKTNDRFACGEETVKDADGNVYETVKVGGFCWLAENLKTTKYQDGTEILKPLSNSDWREAGNKKEGAYACYQNENQFCQTYGALYNIYAVDQGLCPDGWYVPTDKDWKDFEIRLGIDKEEVDRLYWRGEKTGLMIAGENHLWNDDLSQDEKFATTDFKAVPAGYRMSGGNFSWLGGRANFWSSTIEASGWRRTIMPGRTGGIRRTAAAKNFGFSVRCIKK